MNPSTKLHFYIVDDDKVSVEIYKHLLEAAGHKVTTNSSSTKALTEILQLQPDCVLSDLLMPDIDGLELFQQIHKNPTIRQPIFIIITAKSFEYDKRHAYEYGVNAYMTKPVNVDTFVDDILEIIQGNMTLQFWGIRGTLPIPGEKAIRYGGNTCCVTLSIGKRYFFIFDAGSGIKELSNELVKANQFPMKASLFISHPHYDHINGIPFFVPLYMKGNEFEIIGSKQENLTIEDLISNQMDGVYFPITIKEFAAKLTFRNLKEESFKIDDIEIQTILLNHPGRCLGYRVQYKGKSFCYITDNELYLENSPHYSQHEVDRIVRFIHEVDVLIIDSTYTDEEYIKKVGWGHSCISRVVDIADKAKVKLLCLYHHDPDECDKDIDQKLAHANEMLKSRHSETLCIAPHEGMKLTI